MLNGEKVEYRVSAAEVVIASPKEQGGIEVQRLSRKKPGGPVCPRGEVRGRSAFPCSA